MKKQPIAFEAGCHLGSGSRYSVVVDLNGQPWLLDSYHGVFYPTQVQKKPFKEAKRPRADDEDEDDYRQRRTRKKM